MPHPIYTDRDGALQCGCSCDTGHTLYSLRPLRACGHDKNLRAFYCQNLTHFVSSTMMSFVVSSNEISVTSRTSEIAVSTTVATKGIASEYATTTPASKATKISPSPTIQPSQWLRGSHFLGHCDVARQQQRNDTSCRYKLNIVHPFRPCERCGVCGCNGEGDGLVGVIHHDARLW